MRPSQDGHGHADATLPVQPEVNRNAPEALAAFRMSEAFRSTELMRLNTAQVLLRFRGRSWTDADDGSVCSRERAMVGARHAWPHPTKLNVLVPMAHVRHTGDGPGAGITHLQQRIGRRRYERST